MKDFDKVWSDAKLAINDVLSQNLPNSKELLDNLPHFMDLVEKVRLIDDNVSRNLALDFLSEADRDLKSSMILYSNKIYPHAAYHFQQAVEKATKGYVLGFGLLSLEKVKTHTTPRLFMKAFFEETGIKAWADGSGDDRLRKVIEDAYLVIDNDERRQAVARTSYVNLKTDITPIKKWKVITKNVTQGLQSGISIDLPISGLLQSLSSMVTLFILAAISFPHEEYTRYPDKEISPSEYTLNFGIVRAIPMMRKLLQPEIQKLRSVFLEGMD